MDANEQAFCIINLGNYSFFGGQRVLSEQGRMLQPGRNTGFSFILIPFGKWKSYRGVLLLLWILSTFFRIIWSKKVWVECKCTVTVLMRQNFPPMPAGFVSSSICFKTDEISKRFLKPLIRSPTCAECAGSAGPLEKQQ